MFHKFLWFWFFVGFVLATCTATVFGKNTKDPYNIPNVLPPRVERNLNESLFYHILRVADAPITIDKERDLDYLSKRIYLIDLELGPKFKFDPNIILVPFLPVEKPKFK